MKNDSLKKETVKDLRYVKTEEAIRRAYHELLQEKDMDRITVRELVERAKINKTTFYAHYGTLPMLVAQLEAEQISYILGSLEDVAMLFQDSDVFIDKLYSSLEDCNITTIQKHGAGNESFLKKLDESLDEYLQRNNLNVDQYEEMDTILTFVFYGLLGIVNKETHARKDVERVKRFVRNAMTVKG